MPEERGKNKVERGRAYSDPKDLCQDSISSFDNNLLREKPMVLREADWSL